MSVNRAINVVLFLLLLALLGGVIFLLAWSVYSLPLPIAAAITGAFFVYAVIVEGLAR